MFQARNEEAGITGGRDQERAEGRGQRPAGHMQGPPSPAPATVRSVGLLKGVVTRSAPCGTEAHVLWEGTDRTGMAAGGPGGCWQAGPSPYHTHGPVTVGSGTWVPWMESRVSAQKQPKVSWGKGRVSSTSQPPSLCPPGLHHPPSPRPSVPAPQGLQREGARGLRRTSHAHCKPRRPLEVSVAA